MSTNCQDCDGRFNCPEIIPSTCVGYTGKVSSLIKDIVPCKPNINDILEQIQQLIERIKQALGDNRLLTTDCFTFNPLIASQKDINQEILVKVCALETALAHVGDDLTLEAIQITMDINLLCIESELCDPLTTYTLDAIIRKMVTKICSMDARITAIEDFLGL